MTRSIPFARLARSQTCWIIGLPARSASGLPGSRVDASRAGIRTEKPIRPSRRLTRAALVRLIEVARLVLEHHRNVVAQREAQPVHRALQLDEAAAVVTLRLQRSRTRRAEDREE